MRLTSIVIAFCLGLACCPAFAQFNLAHDSKTGRLIIFLHGLRSAPDAAFRSDPKSPTWMKLLSEDTDKSGSSLSMSEYSIATVEYPASLGDYSSFPDVSKSVLEILSSNNYVREQKHLYFLGHSAGGIVTKALLSTAGISNSADERSIHERTRAVFFIATPGSGAWLADVMSRLPSSITGNLLGGLQSLPSISERYLVDPDRTARREWPA
jgi:pimeloyl-ACP methyl ester carboxylesterase